MFLSGGWDHFGEWETVSVFGFSKRGMDKQIDVMPSPDSKLP